MTEARSSKPGHGNVRWFLHVAVLWSFAVAQPLYAKVAENLPFLLAHRLDGTDVVLYALALLLPVPVLLWASVAVAFRLHAGLGRALRFVVVTGLVFLAVYPFLAGLEGLPEAAAIAIAGILALVPAIGYSTRFWNGLLDLLTPAPVLFAAFFLLFTPVRLLLFEEPPEVSGESLDRMETPVVLAR